MSALKTNKILKFIFFYYILVIIVGVLQVFLNPPYFGDYAQDPLELFYMLFRFFFSFLIIIYWLRDKSTEFLWTIIIENITNAYLNLYIFFDVVRGFASAKFVAEYIRFFIKSAGIVLLWDIIIFTISLFILVYAIKNWSTLIQHNKADEPDVRS